MNLIIAYLIARECGYDIVAAAELALSQVKPARWMSAQAYRALRQS